MYRPTLAIVVGIIVSLMSVYPSSLAGNRITYVPPKQKQEKPQDTQSSATRGCPQDLANTVTLLAPRNHVALTVSNRPILFYYLSRKVSVPASITLAEIDGRSAIVEKPINLDRIGINNVKLPQEVELETNKEYLWTITLVCNAKRPSENVEVQATLKRVVPSAELERQLALVDSPRERSQLYAQSGIWYDTLTNLASLERKEASRDFQDLLTQIGWPNLMGQDLSREEQE
ncbi:MAG: DUF928 domain-containing protein [Microcystaceae cyanobacterium]